MSIQHYEEPGQVGSAGAGAAALINGSGAMTATARAESARAMAEVMAQIQVAQAVPRSMKLARERVHDSCTQFRFAKAAFYSYRRGGSVITGPTVKLIRELAAAFGNFQWGVVELDRDSERGYSMMKAWAWDVQTNATGSTTFMVRSVRDLAADEAGGERRKVPLFDERDIYEMNANMGARRVRAMMANLLPAWYVEEAEELCRETIARGPINRETGKPDPLPVRLSNAVDLFAREYQVRQEQLEEVVGAPFGKWGPNDLVQLITLRESLVRGDIKRDDAFPPKKATTGDIAAAQAAAQPEPPAGDAPKDAPKGTAKAAKESRPPDEPPPAPGDPVTGATIRAIESAFATCGWTGRASTRRITVAAALAGADGVTQWENLTEEQGQAALAALNKLLEETPPGGRREAVHDVYSKVKAAQHQARLAEQRAARKQAGGDAGQDQPAAAAAPADGGLPPGERDRAGTEHASADVPAAAGEAAAGPGTGGPPGPDEADPPGGEETPPGPEQPVSEPTLRALLTKVTTVNGLRGTSAATKARRLVVIGVLVTGRYTDFGDPARLTEAEALRAIARFDELAGTDAGRKSMEDVMKKVHDDAIAQRDQASP